MAASETALRIPGRQDRRGATACGAVVPCRAAPGQRRGGRHRGALSVKRYTAFLIRCWNLENSERRIEVEQIRSGATARLASIAEAVAWICEQAERPAGGVSPSDPRDERDEREATHREAAG